MLKYEMQRESIKAIMAFIEMQKQTWNLVYAYELCKHYIQAEIFKYGCMYTDTRLIHNPLSQIFR